MNNRLVELLAYLRELSHIQASGHYVNDEIKEAIKETRKELGLERLKKDQLKESRRLVFEKRLGKPTFLQKVVFEAVYEKGDLAFFEERLGEIEEALDVLAEMGLKFRVDMNKNFMRVYES